MRHYLGDNAVILLKRFPVFIAVAATFMAYAMTPAGDSAFDHRGAVLKEERVKNAELEYQRLTSGLGVPSFKSGRSDFAMADINNNGFVDILSVGDHGSPSSMYGQFGVMVWFNNGDGSFQYDYSGNFGYGAIAVGDVNNDGFQDVAYGIHHAYASGDFGNQLIEVALGDGSGTNWTPWDDGLATSGQTWGMFGTDLGDVNNNGLLDLASIAFGCCDGFHVYLNNGDGSWQSSFGALGDNSDNIIQFADLNNNGNLDFVAGHALGTAFFGDGEGGFVNNDDGLPDFYEGFPANGVSVGDINNDGSHGIALINPGGGIEVFEFDPDSGNWVNYSGNLPSTGSYYYTQLQDMNANGYTDLITFSNGLIKIWYGDGEGNWTEDIVYSLPGNFRQARAFRTGGDLTGNGYADMVLLSNEGTTWNNQNYLYVLAESSEPEELWVTNLYPKGNETFLPGAVRFIDWASAVPENASSHVHIDFSATGPEGPWTAVAENIPNSGRHQWVIPDVGSDHCYLRLSVVTENDSTSKVSERPFRVLGEQEYFSIEAASADENMGEVFGSGTMGLGDIAELEAVPAEGFRFLHWEEQDTIVMDGDEPAGATYSFHVYQDRSLTGYFALAEHNILVEPNNPDYGSVSGSGNYQHGETVEIQANANHGYNFSYWTENDTIIMDGGEPAGATYAFTALKDRHIIANFSPETFFITAAAGPNGMIDPSGEVPVNYSDSVVFSITPDDHYSVQVIYVDGDEITGKTQVHWDEDTHALHFSMVADHHEVMVLFEHEETFVEETHLPAFNLYPNPTMESFTIGFYQPIKRKALVEIVSLSGKIVRQKTVYPGIDGKYRMNTKGLIPGYYHVIITLQGQKAVRPIIIKER